MSHDDQTILKRDNRLCRFRFDRCTTHATRVELDVPEFLGGTTSHDNRRASCRECAKQLRQQRNRAAALLNHREGW